MSRHEDFFNQILAEKARDVRHEDGSVIQATNAINSEVLRAWDVAVGDFNFGDENNHEEMQRRIKAALEYSDKKEHPENLKDLIGALKNSAPASEFFMSQLIRDKLPGIKNLEEVLLGLNRQEHIMIALLINNLIAKKYPFLIPADDMEGPFSYAVVTTYGEIKFFEKDGQLMAQVPIIVTFKADQMEDEQRKIDEITFTTSFSNIAKANQPPKYAFCFESMDFENEYLKTLLEMDPKVAEKQISLHRKMLFSRFRDDEVKKLAEEFDANLREKLENPETDCTNMDLSGLDLTGINLSGKNLTGANLTGANLTGANLTNANLTNAILKGAQLEKITVNRVPFLTYRSKVPVPEKDAVAETSPNEIAEWTEAVEKQGGLHLSEIGDIIAHSTIHSNGSAVKKVGYTAAEFKTRGSTSFGLFENDKRAVINVEGILHSESHEMVANEDRSYFLDEAHFALLMADIAKMNKKIDCIQMPFAIMEKGRQHYVQVQIFKTSDGGIGGRIIDSTANPIAIPVDFIKALLVENRVQLKAVLGAEKNSVTVREVHTNEQLRLGDKKCGIYVAAGMKATAEKVLAEGAVFLPSDSYAKNTVRHQHHLVSKTEAMGYLMGMVNISAEQKQPEKESVASVSGSAQSMRTVHQSAAVDINKHRPSAQPADDDDAKAESALSPSLEKPLLAKSDSTDDGFESIGGQDVADAIEQTTQQAQSVTTSAYVHIINNLLAQMDPEKLKTAVEEALNSYQKDRGWTLNFFRQLSSAGKDYAANALARMKNASSEVAREIAREILFMGVQPDGKTIEVKHNSRVHHLLMTLENQALIEKIDQINLQDLAYVGREFNVEKIIAVPIHRQLAQIYKTMIAADSDEKKQAAYQNLNWLVETLARQENIQNNANLLHDKLRPLIKSAWELLTDDQHEKLTVIVGKICRNDEDNERGNILDLFPGEQQANIVAAIAASAEIMLPADQVNEEYSPRKN